MIIPGIYKEMESADYHAHIDSISRSSIMQYKKSPYHYWAKYLNPKRPSEERNKNYEFGSAFHTFVLEYHKFNQLYAPKPPKVLLKDVGRKAYDEYNDYVEELENSNRIILTDNDYLNLVGMKESLIAHPKAWDLIEGAIIEPSYFWHDYESQLLVKARPDALQGDIYIDLKTCSDASERAYQYEMVKYGYHIQAAMVREAVRKLENKELDLCINICVEKSYPWCVAIYIIDSAAIDAGEDEYKKICLDMARDIAHNSFASYETKIIGMPPWN